jgi:hypothetical protein
MSLDKKCPETGFRESFGRTKDELPEIMEGKYYITGGQIL